MANLTDTTVFGNLTVTRDINIKKNLTIDGSIVVGGGTSSGYDVSIDGHFISASLTANTALYVDADKKIVSSAVTSTELSYLDGVTSAIQTQLNGKAATNQTMYIGTTSVAINRATGSLSLTGVSIDGNSGTATTADKVAKSLTFNNGGSGVASGTTFDGSTARTISYNTIGAEPKITGAATSVTGSDLTIDRALISDGSGKISVSDVTSTELSYLSGASGNIQTQIDDLSASSGSSIVVYTNNVTLPVASNTVNILDGSPGFTFNSATDTMMAFENYVYLLREGVDYTINGSTIVTTGAYFKAAEYNFIVFKNISYEAASGQSAIDNHAASTAAHGATSNAIANTIALRDSLGELWATKVHSTDGNDIADFVEIPNGTEIEFGKVYTRDKSKIRKSNKKDFNVLGIASDTYGFSIGENKEIKQIPIAIGGWVLAHVDRIYPFGTPLTYTNNGYLTKASLLTRIKSSYKILATFDRVEKLKNWNGVEVKNRHWVHIL